MNENHAHDKDENEESGTPDISEPDSRNSPRALGPKIIRPNGEAYQTIKTSPRASMEMESSYVEPLEKEYLGER